MLKYRRSGSELVASTRTQRLENVAIHRKTFRPGRRTQIKINPCKYDRNNN